MAEEVVAALRALRDDGPPVLPAPAPGRAPRRGKGRTVGASARSARHAYGPGDAVAMSACFDARVDGKWKRGAVIGGSGGSYKVSLCSGDVVTVDPSCLRRRAPARPQPTLCPHGEEVWATGGSPSAEARVVWAPDKQPEPTSRGRRLPVYLTLEGCYEQMLRAKEDAKLAELRAAHLTQQLKACERRAAEQSSDARRVAIRLPLPAAAATQAAEYLADAHNCSAECGDRVVVFSGPSKNCLAAVRGMETRLRASAKAAPLQLLWDAQAEAPAAERAETAHSQSTLREQVRTLAADAAKDKEELARLRAELRRDRRGRFDASVVRRLQREVERLAADSAQREAACAAATCRAESLAAALQDARRRAVVDAGVQQSAHPSPAKLERPDVPGFAAMPDSLTEAGSPEHQQEPRETPRFDHWLGSQRLLALGDVAGAEAAHESEFRAACRVQAVWRGRVGRCRASARLASRTDAAAATQLQRVWRGRSDRSSARLRQLLQEKQAEVQELHRQIDVLTDRLAECCARAKMAPKPVTTAEPSDATPPPVPESEPPGGPSGSQPAAPKPAEAPATPAAVPPAAGSAPAAAASPAAAAPAAPAATPPAATPPAPTPPAAATAPVATLPTAAPTPAAAPPASAPANQLASVGLMEGRCGMSEQAAALLEAHRSDDFGAQRVGDAVSAGDVGAQPASATGAQFLGVLDG
eukprot:TRINITY_DN48392_c0_g1_i1.p1 TRINITY_DN48392_c0_g1~~TRINITY_DN48392_c0_g1_i1.p1  ORF type:complete len:715 (+),score=243.76 TRINITY_DN48392_c0_g1_i1:47-2146(+)